MLMVYTCMFFFKSAQAQAHAEFFMNTVLQGMPHPPQHHSPSGPGYDPSLQHHGPPIGPSAPPHRFSVPGGFIHVPPQPQPHNFNPHFCVIIVHREKILYDALTELLSKSERELRKPLMVTLF